MDRLKRKDGRLRRFSRNDFLYAVLKVHEKTLAIYDTKEYNIVGVSLDLKNIE